MNRSKLYISFLIVWWILLAPNLISAQVSAIDSLLQIADELVSDSSKVEVYLEIGRSYSRSGQFSEAHSYYDSALMVAQKNNFTKEEACLLYTSDAADQ